MKELSVEEKAKAYDEAFERAKESLKDGGISQNSIDYIQSIFPELKESEDVKIKKDLIQWISEFPDTIWRNHYKKDVINWLEKQGEQKPAWSALDERNLEGIIDEIEANKNFAPASDNVTYDRYLSWLKSLKERYTWKPSDEQMDSLETAVSLIQSNSLESLYQDLKREKNYE